MSVDKANEGVHWQKIGNGPNLILLHGWGMNGAVWQQLIPMLSQHFTLHIADLPGYGHSQHLSADSIDAIAQHLLKSAPPQATWLGWSLGGLLATHIAYHYPERVNQLVTVASSPKFSAHERWRGIKPEVLAAFTQQLQNDLQVTIERFMALQAMGSPSARQDVKTVKQAVLQRPSPCPHALELGLTLLAELDYRQQLAEISQPTFRLYGRLDGLVPNKVAKDLDKVSPHHFSHTFQQSSHAPFITEPAQFSEILVQQLR
jgi:pimeloyl-[acyl-carrier protein] methyl ester esterase